MESPMRCAKCQHENREGARFCEECGAKLPSICPNCGTGIVNPQAKFCDGCGAKLSVGARRAVPVQHETVPKLEDMQKQLQSRIPQSLADRLFAGAKQMQGEYRLVTAVFADVSGSSGMAREMPLDQYVETMNDCFKMMVDTISIKYEGSINRFIGDCVLAFFGAPITHENDAERAILAALDIRDGVKELNLDVSIGINTGMTYVGEMGSDLYFERSAWGPDVDFARRLQEAAGPGEIHVGAATYRLTSRIFDFEVPVDIEVKGTEERQVAYPVLRVREHPEKLRGIEGLRARMIGREREFADLKEAADDLISGRGSIVTVIGEAGLGKSRLALELKEYLRDKDISWYEGRSVSIGQTVSYWPFLDILRTYVNLGDADDEKSPQPPLQRGSKRVAPLQRGSKEVVPFQGGSKETVPLQGESKGGAPLQGGELSESEFAGKLKESITDLFPQSWEDVLPFLGNLLSIKFGDELDNKLTYFTPEQIRHQTLMRLRGVFTAISRRRPLLLILEDLHWADDLSLDLISLLMDDLAENPLMLLCIYRPERQHRSWQIGDVASRKCLERYTEIALKQLSAVQSRQLVESLLTIENLPEPTKDMILRKSEGNPFFIEEVIRSLIERDLVYREDDRWKARREIEDIDVPDTIQSVLLSRVDRLEDEAKYVLQCASVIGRLFRYRLLDHLAQHERDLEAHLTQLEERDLVYEERSVPEREYAFKHALTQEATYQGILERRRKEFHQRVADGIENLYRERIEEFYEELAHHHRLAGNDEKAIEYLLKSGIKAAGNFANHDALRYFDEAEKLLEKSARPHQKEKAVLCEKRGEVLQLIGQWTQALKEYEEALQWCDDPHDRAEIYREMGEVERYMMEDQTSALKHMKLGLNELPEDDMSVQRIRLEFSIANAEGRQQSLWGNTLLRIQEAAEMAERMGYLRELAILCAHIESWQCELGYYSDEYGNKAIAVAEELGDLPTLAEVCFVVGHVRSRWSQQSIPYLLRAAEVAESIGDVYNQARAFNWIGRVYRNLGQDKRAVESWEKALDIASGVRNRESLIGSRFVMEIYGNWGEEDLVISMFSRIMQTLASFEIDEESQAQALIMRCWVDIYSVYESFWKSYRALGKESEFPSIARKVLEDLLRDVNSRPQRAWYHTKLMDLYLELGDMYSAEDNAKKAVSIIEEMGSPDSMTRLYPAYLMLGDIRAADALAYRFLILNLRKFLVHSLELSLRLGETATTYHRFGQPAAFQRLCEKIEQEHGRRLREGGVNQLLLKSVKPPEDFAREEFEDSFNSSSLLPLWEWTDPQGLSSYSLYHDPDRIEISTNSPTLGYIGPHNATGLSYHISGDFAVETRMGGEKFGGLLVRRGEDVVTFQQWPRHGRPIVLTNRTIIAGYGSLDAESLTLRLERKGKMFRAYCSGDGEDWYSCGWTEAEMEDPVRVGIFASCLENAPKAVTSFDYVKIFRAEGEEERA